MIIDGWAIRDTTDVYCDPSMFNLASFPGLPRFFVLRFFFRVLYWTKTEEQQQKKKTGEARERGYV